MILDLKDKTLRLTGNHNLVLIHVETGYISTIHNSIILDILIGGIGTDKKNVPEISSINEYMLYWSNFPSLFNPSTLAVDDKVFKDFTMDTRQFMAPHLRVIGEYNAIRT
jgi:hypothetical protein